ncbi:putative Ypt/Rab-type GTPase ypt7 [Blattamonas nauphoetae]|uniref:Ypt/Rab-type GTPase ypt7 n=1 Tax=Blattamonas nauphoetae TaxID=2049346 RepID=A0ABQ9XT66_9EUKA|nr:putative Ypt/Rab-type GTPase ypt7 [Blattamonas nauphoetae]
MEDDSKVVEYLLKVLVVGDLGVGKTSFIQRYVHNMFDREYKATIGVDFAYKLIQISSDKVVRLQLWDIAGQERYGNMTRVYYKEALGAIVVFDLSRPNTLDSVKKWKQDIDSKVRLPDANESPLPVILLANKCDLVKNSINPTQLDLFCKENGFVKWFETSAKDGTHVEDAANFLVKQILETDSNPQQDTHADDTLQIEQKEEKNSQHVQLCSLRCDQIKDISDVYRTILNSMTGEHVVSLCRHLSEQEFLQLILSERKSTLFSQIVRVSEKILTNNHGSYSIVFITQCEPSTFSLTFQTYPEIIVFDQYKEKDTTDILMEKLNHRSELTASLDSLVTLRASDNTIPKIVSRIVSLFTPDHWTLTSILSTLDRFMIAKTHIPQTDIQQIAEKFRIGRFEKLFAQVRDHPLKHPHNFAGFFTNEPLVKPKPPHTILSHDQVRMALAGYLCSFLPRKINRIDKFSIVQLKSGRGTGRTKNQQDRPESEPVPFSASLLFFVAAQLTTHEQQSWSVRSQLQRRQFLVASLPRTSHPQQSTTPRNRSVKPAKKERQTPRKVPSPSSPAPLPLEKAIQLPSRVKPAGFSQLSGFESQLQELPITKQKRQKATSRERKPPKPKELPAPPSPYVTTEYAASYLLTSKATNRCAIIETGVPKSLPYILEALSSLKVAVDQIDYVIVTHIHLDHAGCAGNLMKELPKATFKCHRRGARHMADPTILVQSATQVYGKEFMDEQYGELANIPAERIKAVDGPEDLELCNNVIIHLEQTSGHAPHHIWTCLFLPRDTEPKTAHEGKTHENGRICRGIFTGDQYAAEYPFQRNHEKKVRNLMPQCTPPQFDPPQWHLAIERVKELDPCLLFLTHYGVVDFEETQIPEIHSKLDKYVELTNKMIDEHLSKGEGAEDTNTEASIATLILPLLIGDIDPNMKEIKVLRDDSLVLAQGLHVFYERTLRARIDARQSQ